MFYVVDAIEDTKVRLIADDDEVLFIEKETFNFCPAPSDVCIYGENGWEKEEEETQRRKNAIQKRFDRLKKKRSRV